MINAQAGVSAVGIAEKIPESVNYFGRIQFAYRVRPPLCKQLLESRSCFRPEKSVFHPAFSLISVQFRWYNVVVTYQHGRHTRCEQLGGVGMQPIEPAQLIVKLRAWSRIAIGQVQASYDDTIYLGFNVAAMFVVRVSGQHAAAFGNGVVA